jgi:RNA polymerase sigma factor (TIGR02999 family)
MTSDDRQPERTSSEAITELLVAMQEGRPEAVNRLMPLVYDELREMAHHKLRFERRGHTLDTTALVHEAYLRLVRQERVQWQSRTHFYALAAQAMRRILVNYAAKHKAAKRGGGAPHVPIDEALDAAAGRFSDERIEQILAVDQALEQLEAFNERGCRVVEYRFFGGMTHAEIAEVMGLSTITVRRAWTAAKLWLRREMTAGGEESVST